MKKLLFLIAVLAWALPAEAQFIHGGGGGGAGTGDVAGPGSSTDGHAAVFDGTDGKKIKDGGTLATDNSTASHLLCKDSDGHVENCTLVNLAISGTTDPTLTATGACGYPTTIDGHGATTNLTTTQVTCPGNAVDNTGQTGANASVVWPTKALNQAIRMRVATTVATTYTFEFDFGAAVAYPDGNYTTAYRYCGFAATNVTEGNEGMASCDRSSTKGASGIACNWTSGIGTSGCHN
jgi:hypothetical protein